MAYSKTTWTTSTAITTANMNNLESQYDTFMEDYANGHNHDSDYYPKATMDSTFWHATNQGTGSGADADLILDEDEATHHIADLTAAGAPAGMIIMFYGSSAPTGWVFCDGNNSTPDLRDKYLVGAGDTYTTATSYGNNTVNPTVSCTVGSVTSTAANQYHNHTFVDEYMTSPGGGAGTTPVGNASTTQLLVTTSSAGSGGTHTHTATYDTDTCDLKPPSRAIHYIMKS
jgi:hypothetical protein